MSEGQICTQASEELLERLELLVTVGKQVEATSESINTDELPADFDVARFKRAQKLCKRYYTNMSISSGSGITFLVQIESILVPLLKTGRSRTLADLYDRYVDTARYIRECYETDFYDKQSKGWHKISLVRAMHQRIHKLMNADPAFRLEQPNVWVNQYDMAITQFAFIGLFIVSPIRCGAHGLREDELSDICYYWKLISHYFGIEQRFNIFVYHDDMRMQLDYAKLILDHINRMLDSKPRNLLGLKMAEGILFAFEDLNRHVNFNIIDHWWRPYISLSGAQLAGYTFSDRVKFAHFKLVVNVLFKNDTIARLMNHLQKRRFDKFCASGDKIKRKLAKKHKDYVCEAEPV